MGKARAALYIGICRYRDRLKLCFVYLLQAGEHNFFISISHNLGPTLYRFPVNTYSNIFPKKLSANSTFAALLEVELFEWTVNLAIAVEFVTCMQSGLAKLTETLIFESYRDGLKGGPQVL